MTETEAAAIPAIEIRCAGADGGTVLHAIRQAGNPEWHWSGPGYVGVLRGQRQNVITALADAIGRGEVYRIEVRMETEPRQNLFLLIDRLGHTWHDGTYWPPDEYLSDITGDQ